ncbi:MAG: histidine phosphatase family protein [Thermodesulfobacteriota bacterium]|nr:histidine phosphatase family protein [Thermodesulfobacteriota bacterium]
MEPDRTRIYLARHGEVVNHGVYNGQTDVDITPAGQKQMERLRDLLQDKNLSAVYSSDLLRTQKGAEIIAKPHGLLPQAFPHFREMHFGRWQGLSYPEVIERYPGDIPQWINNLDTFRIPAGESLMDVRDRAIPKLQELIELHRGQEFALMCHGALNRVILAEALHLSFAYLLRIEQDYGCLNIIDYTPSWTVVKLING